MYGPVTKMVAQPQIPPPPHNPQKKICIGCKSERKDYKMYISWQVSKCKIVQVKHNNLSI